MDMYIQLLSYMQKEATILRGGPVPWAFSLIDGIPYTHGARIGSFPFKGPPQSVKNHPIRLGGGISLSPWGG